MELGGESEGWEITVEATHTRPSLKKATYGYDQRDRVTSINWSGPGLYGSGENSSFAYDYASSSYGLVGTVTGPAHTVTHTWEASRSVLDTKTNASTGGTISAYDYSVNSIGQRTAVATSGSAFLTAPQWGWSYNTRGELTQADDSSTANNDRAYQFDTIGNREKTVNGLLAALPATANYASNSLNQYTSVQEGTAAVVPAYDADGNATSYPLPTGINANATLEWDAENRLIKATTAGADVLEFAYDSQSRRISKTATPNGGSASSTLYLYDGWNCIAEYIGSSLERTSLWGSDLSGSMQGAGGVGGLLQIAIRDPQSQIDNRYYPTYDGNGNVSEYLDSTSTVAAHFEYDPFGNTTVNTDTTSLFDIRFSTKKQDLDTGLYYYGYRYYDPVTGRWPSRDPIEEEGGVNLYGFVENDGLNGIDHLGWYTRSYVGGSDTLADGKPGYQLRFAMTPPGAASGIPLDAEFVWQLTTVVVHSMLSSDCEMKPSPIQRKLDVIKWTSYSEDRQGREYKDSPEVCLISEVTTNILGFEPKDPKRQLPAQVSTTINGLAQWEIYRRLMREPKKTLSSGYTFIRMSKACCKCFGMEKPESSEGDRVDDKGNKVLEFWNGDTNISLP